MTRHVAALVAGLGLGAAALSAQQPGRFVITPNAGLVRYDRTSALSSTKTGLSKLWPSAGLSAMYAFRSNVHGGFYLEAGRVETSPDYFPLVLLRIGSNYELHEVSQRVVVLSYGLTASLDLPIAKKLAPYVRAGVGQHSVFPDVQRSNSTKSVTGTEFSLGGGFSYAVGSGGNAIRLQLIDNMWSNWDRDALNPSNPNVRNTTFPEDNPEGINWTKPSVIHNLRVSLGFSFTPSVGGTR